MVNLLTDGYIDQDDDELNPNSWGLLDVAWMGSIYSAYPKLTQSLLTRGTHDLHLKHNFWHLLSNNIPRIYLKYIQNLG